MIARSAIMILKNNYCAERNHDSFNQERFIPLEKRFIPLQNGLINYNLPIAKMLALAWWVSHRV